VNHLAQICTPSKQLYLPQLFFLRDKIEQSGGNVDWIHLFLLQLTFPHETFFLKMNILDHEFYLFSEKDSIQVFRSLQDVEHYLHTSGYIV